MAHNTRWEDEGMAGIECNGEDAGCLSAGEDYVCPLCGMKLVLNWKVTLKEYPRGDENARHNNV